MGRVTLRDANSSANAAGAGPVGLVCAGGAEAALCPWPMWQWTLAAVHEERKEGPSGIRSGVFGCCGGWTAEGTPSWKLGGASVAPK